METIGFLVIVIASKAVFFARAEGKGFFRKTFS